MQDKEPRFKKTLAETSHLAMEDWQIAGLAFLLFKGGLNWFDGSFEVEGRKNLDAYLKAADQAGKPILKMYLENIGAALEKDALTQDKPLQKQVRATQIAIRELIFSMNANMPWTYCGAITSDIVIGMDRVDGV